MYVCGQVCKAHEGQKRESDSPGTGAIVTMQMLGTECRAFGRAASGLNH